MHIEWKELLYWSSNLSYNLRNFSLFLKNILLSFLFVYFSRWTLNSLSNFPCSYSNITGVSSHLEFSKEYHYICRQLPFRLLFFHIKTLPLLVLMFYYICKTSFNFPYIFYIISMFFEFISVLIYFMVSFITIFSNWLILI